MAELQNWDVLDEVFLITRELGVEDAEVAYWLVTPSTYWDEQDEPFNHCKDLHGMIEAAKAHFNQMW